MKKAVIYYLSKKGTTKYFGEEICEYLETKDIDVKSFSVYDYKPEQLKKADMVFFGAWTHGLFIVLQHPDKPWVEFARQLPDLKGKKIGLFTTYKIATGSLFKKMQKYLNGKIDGVDIILKAKGEKILEEHKKALDKLF